MKTYNDILKLIKEGKTVKVTSHFGNTVTYFKNNKGQFKRRFNECKESFFIGSDVEIHKTSNIEII